MSNVGKGSLGKTYIGQGTGSPHFAEIGTDSGLTDNGVLVAHGTSPFTATPAGTTGQVLMGNTGSNPTFQNGGAVVGQTITGGSGGALSPTAGNWNILGSATGTGTSPVSTAGAASTLTVNVQTSQALAGADATKIGLSNFDSSSFAVAATGFVTLSTTGVGKTITGNTGGALSPTANNWSILTDNSTVVFAGAGSTLTLDFAATNNLLLGSEGASITTATNNASLGYECFTNVTSATQVTAIGFQANRLGTTGSYNTYIGS